MGWLKNIGKTLGFLILSLKLKLFCEGRRPCSVILNLILPGVGEKHAYLSLIWNRSEIAVHTSGCGYVSISTRSRNVNDSSGCSIQKQT